MPDLVEAASAILTQAERKVEIAAQNIANATTPGYKRRIAFAALIEGADHNGGAQTVVRPVLDARPGKLVSTGSPFDLALTGPGVFALRGENGIRYSRQGRFTRDGEGRLIDAAGGALQLVNGNDLVVNSTTFEVRADGLVLEGGTAQGRVAVFADAEPGSAAAPAPPAEVHMQQGVYEASNVSTGDEMVMMMEALRRAEAAQRMVLTYDELMARAITTFGESAR